jgi:hypothetical protein
MQKTGQGAARFRELPFFYLRRIYCSVAMISITTLACFIPLTVYI